MKQIAILMCLVLLTIIPVGFADILASHSSANHICGVDGTSYFAFKFDTDVIIDSISFYAYNTLGSDVPLQYTIYSNNPFTNFPTSTILQTTMATVTNTTGEVVIDFSDVDFVYNADSYYWIRLGGDVDVCYQTFFDGSTDVYVNGGLNGINSIHDPRFKIEGSVHEPEVRDYDFTDYDYTITFGFGGGLYSVYWAIYHETDFNISNITYSLDQTNNDDRKFIYGYLDKLNTTKCGNQIINSSLINSTCWDSVGQIYDSGFIGDFSYRVTRTFTPTITQLDGKEIYRLRMVMYSYFNGAQNANLRVTNSTSYSNILGSGYFSASTVVNEFITNGIAYIRIRGETLDSCSGSLCEEEPIIDLIPQPINETGYVTPEEREKAIGLLLSTQDPNNPNKLTARGVGVSLLIILTLLVALGGVTSSPIILTSALVKLLILMVAMKTLPFYIVLLLLISILGIAVWRGFTQNNGG